MVGPGNGGKAQSFEALRASEELHRATLSNISDAVFMADDEGKFTFVCPNVDVIFGFSPDEVQEMGRIEALLGEDLFDPAELDSRIEIQNVEREVTTKSGARRTVLMHLKRVSIAGGTVLCTCRDVTELKEAEKQLAVARLELAHAARLALVGELTASIVHEIQQPLTAISANTEAAAMHVGRLAVEARGELGAILTDIHEATASAAEIIDRLRNLARKRPMEAQPVDVNEMLSGIMRLMSADALRRRVRMYMEAMPLLPKIPADRISLQHVVLNLVMNAMEAMEPVKGHREVVLQTRLAGNWVELAVCDSGPGVAADMQTKIFDAFVTTKREGIGLGLSIARSIVEAHRGRISVSNGLGGGAIFVIALPVM
ncbi:MAG TPA: ATP-binding protein [Steroidobacteraceae bacterium]|nr:ATP-binding protein [Steroidobacteraceae bacterium]